MLGGDDSATREAGHLLTCEARKGHEPLEMEAERNVMVGRVSLQWLLGMRWEEGSFFPEEGSPKILTEKGFGPQVKAYKEFSI